MIKIYKYYISHQRIIDLNFSIYLLKQLILSGIIFIFQILHKRICVVEKNKTLKKFKFLDSPKLLLKNTKI